VFIQREVGGGDTGISPATISSPTPFLIFPLKKSQEQNYNTNQSSEFNTIALFIAWKLEH